MYNNRLYFYNLYIVAIAALSHVRDVKSFGLYLDRVISRNEILITIASEYSGNIT